MNTQTRMCEGVKCSRDRECYRRRAIPVSAPRKQEYWTPKLSGDACAFFMPINGRVVAS